MVRPMTSLSPKPVMNADPPTTASVTSVRTLRDRKPLPLPPPVLPPPKENRPKAATATMAKTKMVATTLFLIDVTKLSQESR